MGRIEEALRRAETSTERPARSAADEGVFVSPWSFREPAVATQEAVHVPVNREGALPPPVNDAVHEPTQVDVFPGAEMRTSARFDPEWSERLITATHANAFLVEQFRQLAARLHQAQNDANTRVIMVTSAEPGEGKSLTSLNLALTLTESYGRRVLLIDADLRRPSLHAVAGIANSRGLGDTLKASLAQKVPVYKITDKLLLVPAGKPDPDPMSALTSPRMEQILKEAASRFDWIVVDTPPLGPIADAHLLAPMIDGVLMVVRAERTHYASARKAIDRIGRDRIIGVVLNASQESVGKGYYQYYPTASHVEADPQ